MMIQKINARILPILMAAAVFTFAVPVDAFAARSESIAVVVNSDAITMSDVNDRISLIMASSGLQNNPEIREKLAPQIIGVLVDEQIRLQEARRLDVDASAAEIAQGFAVIAEQNNFKPEDFRGMMEQGGLNIKTLEEQIRAQIAWTKVVQKKLQPQVVVTDGDVDTYLERLQANIGKPEYLVSEIFMPVDASNEAANTQQIAYNLVREIRENKASFGKVARQFSKSAGASQGGNIGWVSQGQLQDELDRALPMIAVDSVSEPIRTASGFHILLVREKRLITPESLPDRETVRSTIGLERLERLQRRYLLDLKSAAMIDSRVNM